MYAFYKGTVDYMLLHRSGNLLGWVGQSVVSDLCFWSCRRLSLNIEQKSYTLS